MFSQGVSCEQAIWTLVEPTMYLIAACLPPLRGPVAHFNTRLQATVMFLTVRSWFASSRHSQDAGTQPNGLAGFVEILNPEAHARAEDGSQKTRPVSKREAVEVPKELLTAGQRTSMFEEDLRAGLKGSDPGGGHSQF